MRRRFIRRPRLRVAGSSASSGPGDPRLAVSAETGRSMSATHDQIGWLGHATTLIEVDGVALLTDPLLHRRTAHLHRVAAPVTMPLPSIDAVLLSHVHWDHLDLRSLARVGHGVRMVGPRGDGKLLAREGF